MRAEKGDRRRIGVELLGIRHLPEALAVKIAAERAPHFGEEVQLHVRTGAPQRGDDIIDNAVEFQIAIGRIAIASGIGGLLLRAVPPAGQAAGRWA